MKSLIDANVLANLLRGQYTCYWCGGVADIEHISSHVDKCLKEVNWLRQHVEQPSVLSSLCGDKVEVLTCARKSRGVKAERLP